MGLHGCRGLYHRGAYACIPVLYSYHPSPTCTSAHRPIPSIYTYIPYAYPLVRTSRGYGDAWDEHVVSTLDRSLDGVEQILPGPSKTQHPKPEVGLLE